MISIIDYQAGNTQSVMNALDRLSADYTLTSDKGVIKASDRVIFPGVGHATHAMSKLQERDLIETITSLSQPVLGICLGMQLLYDSTAEGDSTCLGIANGQIKKFDSTKMIVPHMGWNKVSLQGESPLFHNIPDETYFYMVHSYFAEVTDQTIGTTKYGLNFCSAVQKENFYGVQFHPEKSGPIGLQLLQNFINISI